MVTQKARTLVNPIGMGWDGLLEEMGGGRGEGERVSAAYNFKTRNNIGMTFGWVVGIHEIITSVVYLACDVIITP